MMRRIEGTVIQLKQGDITLEETDAIVNAANPSLMGGGGVDGAIHKAGGPAILEDCKKIRATCGPLPTGHAVITGGGDLKSRHVIHTVGPIWAGGEKKEDQFLRDCYQSSLALAVEKGLRTIAFPSISTGAYGFPLERAARVAIETVVAAIRKYKKSPGEEGFPESVTFVLFSDHDLTAYRRALEEVVF